VTFALAVACACWAVTLAALFLFLERQNRWHVEAEERAAKERSDLLERVMEAEERARKERSELLERIMEPDYTKLVQARVAVQYGADIKRSLEEMTANAGREQEEVGR